MNARLYDPKIGKFFSPDNYITDPGNPQSYNRYSYALNNPLKYTDPSGNMYLGLFGNGGYSEGYMAGVFDGIVQHNASNCMDELDYTISVRYIGLDGGVDSKYDVESLLKYYRSHKSLDGYANGWGLETVSSEEEKIPDNAPSVTKPAIEVETKRWSWFDCFLFDLGEAIKSVYNWGEGAAKDVYGLFTDPHPHAVNAHNWYSFGMGLPMYMDASELDMSGITQKDLTPTNIKDIYTLNFFNVQGGAKRYTHTDITLGEITLQRVKGDEFRIMNDRYDHDMHPWSTSSKRNIATIALWIVNVGASPMPVHVLAMNAYHIGKDGAFGTYEFDIIFYKNIITIQKK